MRNRCKWILRPTEDEFSELWNSSTLVVDANVLLDLYRYNPKTRDLILSSIERFPGKKWITNQTCDEFIRNRTEAITSVSKAFNQAEEEIQKINDAKSQVTAKLRSIRILPDDLQSKLDEGISKAISDASEKIAEQRSIHPDFLTSDFVLEKIFQIFDGSVGSPFSDDQLSTERLEGERRKKLKIPPGYEDSSKDGDRVFGDYFMWKQMLLYAKDNASPVIFVTSEQKEDWWEERSGKTIGPRQELIKEAFEFTGQRVLIYKTQQFLTITSLRSGAVVDQDALEEIKEISKRRTAEDIAVVRMSQIPEIATAKVNNGTICVKLKRPVYNFTCSGKLSPELDEIPTIRAKLIRHPNDVPSLKITSGTGTRFDFNIHVKTLLNGLQFPVGEYEFEYTAECNQEDNLHNAENSSSTSIAPQRISGLSLFGEDE